MRSYPGGGTAGIELDVQWGHVGGKRKSGGYTLFLAKGVVDGSVLISDSKLRANFAFKVWDFSSIPRSEAQRVAVVFAQHRIVRVVEGAMVVHLLAGIVFVNCLAVSLNVVDTVLQRVYSPCDRLFTHALGVPQSPSQQQA